MNIQDQIILTLMRNPGIRARKIAQLIGSTRHEVNHYLYGVLREYCEKDDASCWRYIGGYTFSADMQNNVANPPVVPAVQIIHDCEHCIYKYMDNDDRNNCTQDIRDRRYTEGCGFYPIDTIDRTAYDTNNERRSIENRRTQNANYRNQ